MFHECRGFSDFRRSVSATRLPKTAATRNKDGRSKRESVRHRKRCFQRYEPDDARENKLGIALIKNLARDQKTISTSPAHIRMGEATWLVPFAGLTAGFW